MKFSQAAVFLGLLVCASSYSLAKNEGADSQQGPKFSEAAKTRLIEASNRFVADMCSGDVIEPEVMSRICVQATNRKFGQRVTSFGEAESRCQSCASYVDPMCMNDCPQLFM